MVAVQNNLKRFQKGFTLIELLVVIGILAVLLAIVLIAINPGRQFAQANNTQRRSDVTAILNAVNQYGADNAGNLPPGMPVSGATITLQSTSSTLSGTGVNLCNALVPTYIAQLPRDPQLGSYTGCAVYNTTYEITVASASAGSTPRITVSSPNAELGVVISVTR